MTTNPITPPSEPLQPRPTESSARRVFIGPNGLRAGWRLLIYLAIMSGLAAIVGLVFRLFGYTPKLAGGQMTPSKLALLEGIILFYSGGAALIMSRIEGRKFAAYGLPLSKALSSDFWVGILWGFLTTSATLLAIFLLHGVQLSGPTIHGTTLVTSAVAWTLTFLLVGLSEEFSFRGYSQATLASGIGFWPAAFVLSAAFGLAHTGNSGENILGESSVVLFGLLFCLFLRRRGNLWFAVGFHMGFDWGQTFFYGVPDSGLLPYHNFLSATFSGPRWLTGGTVGPEASIFTPIALLLVGIIFHFKYREARYVPLKTDN
jgi:membrane protease YdiL (CAAX protease family)